MLVRGSQNESRRYHISLRLQRPPPHVVRARVGDPSRVVRVLVAVAAVDYNEASVQPGEIAPDRYIRRVRMRGLGDVRMGALLIRC